MSGLPGAAAPFSRKDIELHVVRNRISDTGDLVPSTLRDEYFKLRAREFERLHGKKLYEDGADSYDKMPETMFAVATLRGRVVAGARLIVNPKGKHPRLHFESDGVTFELVLPHVNKKDISYAEIGAMASDHTLPPDVIFGSLLSMRLYEEAMTSKCADVMVLRVVPENTIAVTRMLDHANIPALIHDRLDIKVGGKPRTMMTAALRPDFPLWEPGRERQEFGMTPREFLQHLRKEKRNKQTQVE